MLEPRDASPKAWMGEKKGRPEGRPFFWFDRITVEIALIDQ